MCHIDNMTAKQFNELRVKAGYSQEKLAKAMRVSIRTVSRWEAGKVPKLAELALKYIIEQQQKGAR